VQLRIASVPVLLGRERDDLRFNSSDKSFVAL
jgi:hypothetical protein